MFVISSIVAVENRPENRPVNRSESAHELKVLFDQGTGRAYITIVDDDCYLPLVSAVAEQIARTARSIVVKSQSITSDSWRTLSEALVSTIAQIGVRQASLIGMGAGATLAQNIALIEPKTVRSMVVVDAASRPHPSVWDRFIDALEARLPFGLPLRLGSKGFNVRSYVHRFRCPLLIVSTRRASTFIRDELKQLALLSPTAWRVDLAEIPSAEEAPFFAETVIAFQETPVKCPQKNLGERRS
jgi:pimeloyl-ACP methyl ester carboxylesterase